MLNNIDQIKNYYSDKLVYHNFLHALKVWEKAEEIADVCLSEGQQVDKEVLYLAALFHDAGYHLDHVSQGYCSKEELSSALAEKYLQKHNYPQNKIVLIKDAILGTQQNSEFLSFESKILRAADLSGLAGKYQDFIKNNKLLKTEYEFLNKTIISEADWKNNTKKLIDFYLSQNICLTRRYFNKKGESLFHKQVKLNLARYLSE